ncbi:MAG: type VI secretion system baseplate subunit TssF [Isosphaeraceae bacterium]
MPDDLLRYYLDELSHLREAGAHFREKYPAVADQLRLMPDACEDPHVERLLEGFAFLTARVRAKLDDEFPQITDALFGMLYPHAQRPLPSAAIARFGLGRGPAKVPPPGGDTIDAGVPLRSLHPSYRDCKFRTVYPVSLWPLEVTDARLITERVPVADARPGTRALLALKVRCESPGGFGKLVGLDRLRFHIAGEDRVAYALHELLGTAVTRVELVGRDARGDELRTTLAETAVELVGFGPDEGLFPYPSRSPRGYRLIQELFYFWKKFFFFDVKGLGATSKLGGAAECQLLIHLGKAPRERIHVGPDRFLLGCTPVVNLFKAVSVPIRLTRTRTEYPVIPDLPSRDQAEVYSIDRVVGSGSALDEPEEYRPLYEVRAAGDSKRKRAGSYWYAHRRPSNRNRDEGTDVSMSFSTPGFDPSGPSDDVVTVSLTCTNRDRLQGMPVGQRSGDLEPEAPIPSGTIQILNEPCPTVRPPLGRDAHWRLVSNLSMNYLSMVDSVPSEFENDEAPPEGRGTSRDALLAMLDAYNFADSEIVRAELEGITAVSSRRVMGYTPRRTVVGGVEVTVTFDDAHFMDSSPFLLACVLERFFGLAVTINSFSQMFALRTRGEILKKWPPRIGEKPLL